MNETKIKLLMEGNKNITITNLNDNSSFTVSYSDKTITAPSIYEILKFQLNNTYLIESNIESINDEKDKAYFQEIITLLEDIVKEINEMLEVKEESDSEDSNERIVEEEQ